MQTTMTQTEATIYNLVNRACEKGKKYGAATGKSIFFVHYANDTNANEMQTAWNYAQSKKFRKGTQYTDIAIVG